jgi:uncharacterized protein YhbP (UPF0306 family)
MGGEVSTVQNRVVSVACNSEQKRYACGPWLVFDPDQRRAISANGNQYHLIDIRPPFAVVIGVFW